MKLNKTQLHFIMKMKGGYRDPRGEDPTDFVQVLSNTVEYSRDGPDLLASRVVLRDGRSGTDARMDWHTEMYRLSPDGTCRKV